MLKSSYNIKCTYTCFSFQWNLVCEYNILSETTQTVLVVGVMVGALGFSALADAIGRKTYLPLLSVGYGPVVGITCAFVDNYYVFAAARFLTGALQQVNMEFHLS